jgi:hypothetical protein
MNTHRSRRAIARTLCAAGAALLSLSAGAAAPYLHPAAQAQIAWPGSGAVLGARSPLPRPLAETAPSILGPMAWTEQKVVADGGASGDLFGFRTLIAGDLAFVSAPAPLTRSGAVYVYRHSDAGWLEVQRITATQPANAPPNWSDFFGWSLSLSSSGDRLLVGAPEMFDPMFGPAGGAYVFTRGADDVWTQSAQFSSPQPVTLSWFGRAVAFAGDLAIVGETSYDMTTQGSRGAAHVFAETNGSWSYRQLVRSSDGAPMDDANFGGAIASAGGRVAIGAPGPDWSSTGSYPQGAVYLFSIANGQLTETQKLAPPDGAPGDQFGYAVAASGDRVLVGAPAAGVDGIDHRGAVYLFAYDGSAYAQTQKFVDPAGEAFDQLGQSVALDGDAGAAGMWSHNDDPSGTQPPPKAGKVQLFGLSGSQWTITGSLAASGTDTQGNSFGWDVAMQGASVLAGADADASISQYQGAAYFYARDTLFADGFDGTP